MSNGFNGSNTCLTAGVNTIVPQDSNKYTGVMNIHTEKFDFMSINPSWLDIPLRPRLIIHSLNLHSKLDGPMDFHTAHMLSWYRSTTTLVYSA
jgi:hypothetical protein